VLKRLGNGLGYATKAGEGVFPCNETAVFFSFKIFKAESCFFSSKEKLPLSRFSHPGNDASCTDKAVASGGFSPSNPSADDTMVKGLDCACFNRNSCFYWRA
jgi:hypothetical protein